MKKPARPLTLSALLKKLAALRGRTLITFHSLGDVDSVASAVALAGALERKNKRVSCEVRCIDSATASARRVLEGLDFPEPRAIKELNSFKNVLLVDVSTPTLLGDWGEAVEAFRGVVIAVDNHYHTRHLKNAFVYVNLEKPSASEIVFEIAKKLGAKPSAKTASLLLAGIAADTALFKSAENATLGDAGELARTHGADFKKIRLLTAPQPDLGERIAVLKAVAGVRVEKIGKGENAVLVALANAHAFELQCASALVELGCDYAFVVNEREGRASAVKAQGARGNVGKIMESVGAAFRGSGGGHEFVGGARGEPTRERADAAGEEFLARVKLVLGESVSKRVWG
ncbi:DHH family phosphoesterase [Candidatus Micrarchaeota archaeon]|nr:DHH family phosphoesterase [Candidatus Micrarchaeota archaeon]